MLGWVWVTAVELVGRHGYALLFLVVLLESALDVRVVPSELAVPAGAAVLVGTPLEFARLVGLLTAGAVVGSALAYQVYGADHRGALRTYSETVRPSRVRVERGRRWLSRWGVRVLCWGRLFPGVRGALSAAAGIDRTGLAVLVGYSAVGWATYLAALVWLVYPGSDGSAPVDPVVDATLGLLVRFRPTVTADPVGWGVAFAASGTLVLVAWTLRDTLHRTV